MEYSEALAYLKGLEVFGEKPGLERIQALLDSLGNPQYNWPTVHVAGTNGKGSTATMIAEIAQAAGLHTGLYTSPSMGAYNQRIKVDGEDISDELLAELVDQVRRHVAAVNRQKGLQPVAFEVGTALAFLAFDQARVDLAVIEVGLGGRLDATNVLRPECVVITPIGYDHTDVLGEHLSQIAAEKAAIIKEAAAVVSARQRDEARLVIERVAGEVGVRACFLGRDFQVSGVQVSGGGGLFSFHGLGKYLPNLRVGMLGRHQVDNAAVATAACLSLAQRGYPISEDHIRRGLQKAQVPGRLELWPGDPPILLDGAHNADGVEALRRALGELFPCKRLVFVIGVLNNKPVEEMLAILAPMDSAFVCTAPVVSRKPPVEPDALARRLRATLSKSGEAPTVVTAPLEGAIPAARRLASGGEALICVCGSLYLVAGTRQLLAIESTSMAGQQAVVENL